MLFQFEYVLYTLLKVQQMPSNSTFTLALALIRTLCLQKQRASSRDTDNSRHTNRMAVADRKKLNLFQIQI